MKSNMELLKGRPNLRQLCAYCAAYPAEMEAQPTLREVTFCRNERGRRTPSNSINLQEDRLADFLDSGEWLEYPFLSAVVEDPDGVLEKRTAEVRVGAELLDLVVNGFVVFSCRLISCWQER